MDSELLKIINWFEAGGPPPNETITDTEIEVRIVEAARRWERLGLTRCDTCEGSGYLAQESTGSPADVSCPDCSGFGWLIPDTMIEAAADAVWIDGFNDENGNVANWKPKFLRAVLVAAFTNTEAPDGQ